MTIMLSENSNGRIALECKAAAFVWEFGRCPSVSKRDLFDVMMKIADFVNNKCDDECIFCVE